MPNLSIMADQKKIDAREFQKRAESDPKMRDQLERLKKVDPNRFDSFGRLKPDFNRNVPFGAVGTTIAVPNTVSQPSSLNSTIGEQTGLFSSTLNLEKFCNANPNSPECSGILSKQALDSPRDYCARNPKSRACRRYIKQLIDNQKEYEKICKRIPNAPLCNRDTFVEVTKIINRESETTLSPTPIDLTVQGKNLEFRDPDLVPVDDINTIYDHQKVDTNMLKPQAPLSMQQGVAHYGSANLSNSCSPSRPRALKPSSSGGYLNQVKKANMVSNTFKTQSVYGDLDVYKKSFVNPLDYIK